MTKPIIPEAALGQHIAVLGKNGSGKTFAAKAAIVEPALAAHKRVGIVDPTGAWWGLRSSRDGKGPGFQVLVLGGDHGDLPLPVLGGAAVARLLIEQGVNLVADTSQLTVGERTRWMIDFAGSVYRLNRTPLHLVLDEAHVFAPQGKVPDPDTGKMLHAVNQLASGGRSRGIRLTMITQRPQKLHKDSLTTADTLIAMRVLAPHDREAVKAWIDGCGDPAQGKQVLDSLASLQRGEGWVWYPEGAHLVRVKFPAIRTFDSSATPTDGHALATPKGAAEIDLAEIRVAMAEAVKEAEANDPKILRAKLAAAQRDLEVLKKARPAAAPAPSKALIAAEYSRGRGEGFEAGRLQVAQGLAPVIDRFLTLAAGMQEQAQGLRDDLVRGRYTASKPQTSAPPPARPPAPARRVEVTERRADVTAPQQRILDALAWLASIRPTDPADRTQLALLADSSPKSSGYANNLGALRSAGLIEYPTGGTVKLTDAGHAAAAAPASAPTSEELHRTLQNKLSAPQWRILKALIDCYPDPLGRDELAEQADTSSSSSGYANNLGALRSLGFIDYPAGGQVVALPVLFING